LLLLNLILQILLLPLASKAVVAPGVPRDSNTGNTGGYDGTRVEAQLLVDVDKDTEVIHFIRDNNDPRVVTKSYLVNHVDPYEIRDYLREMVQAKRVGNTAMQQNYPSNTATAPVTATTSSAVVTLPAQSQPGLTQAPQLGSNTAVECLRYIDGTGLLIVSAEEYRFKDHANGMGFDSMIAFLDRPEMGSNFGTQTFFYIPKYVPARNLMPLIENVGLNVSDVSELWQGMDLVTYDPDLNWLLFDVVNFSQAHVEKMLNAYDVPIPEVRLKITVYEVYSENDEKIGIDFQAWKNNQGVDFFSVGGRYRDNWSALYNGALIASGSERTSFYNFNPKWNTRYIDFLTSVGKAEVLHSGELCIRNNTPASFSKTTQVFYIDSAAPAVDSSAAADMGVGAYRLLSEIADRVFAPGTDYPVAKGNQQVVTKSDSYGFTLEVVNASVNLAETRFTIKLSNSSLIGFDSNGAPRISDNNVVNQSVSLPYGTTRFVIGGLKKQNVVDSSTGIPWLKDIPVLGYLFSSKSTSIKDSELIVMAECQWASPPESLFTRGSSKSVRR
jgi:type II secretory pathway component GspD/PulD (secretin)